MALEINFTQEEEFILLGSWLSNRHREDIKLFNGKLFKMQDAFNMIKDGQDLDALLMQKVITRGDACKLLENNEMFYLTAKKQALQYKQQYLLNQFTTVEDLKLREALINEIEQTRCYIEEREYKPKAENLASIFFEEAKERREEQTAKYGLQDLDTLTGGIHRKQLITLGARPGVGKSAISLQIADNVQKQGYKVLYIPLEMTVYETLERLLIRHEYITGDEAREGNTPANKVDSINAYLNELESNGKFIIYEGLADVEAIRDKIRNEQPYMVVIDQLTQVIPNERTKDVRERYINITRTLKEIARQENVAILLLSQLNRDAEKVEHPGLANLHESDSTGQDADVVLILTRDQEQPQEDILKRMTLTLVKQRQGISNRDINLAYYGAKYDFKNSFKESDAKPLKKHTF